MIKAKAGALVILGITEDNLKGFETKGPIYISKEELEIDVDIQLLTGTLGLGVDGRRCLTQSLTEEMLERMKQGGYITFPRTEYSSYEVMVFYGKTNQDCIKTLNEGLKGGYLIPTDLRDGEAVSGRVVGGKIVYEKGPAPPGIFRNGLPR